MDTINFRPSQKPTPAGGFQPMKPSGRVSFFRRYRLPSILGFGLAILAAGLLWWFLGNAPEGPAVSTTVTPQPTKPALVPSLLNGVLVTSDVANRRPVATMIENSPDARPQRGLVSADIVYEALVEGSITRFMAVFQQTLPVTAGPIRSARSYYIDWLSEYDAIYAHAGGSPTALSRIRQYNIKDYSYDNTDAYWREPIAGLASEHTLFGDISKVYTSATTKMGWPKTSNYQPWLFRDSSSTPSATGAITLNISTSQFQVVWNFDKTTNQYSRVMNGTPHVDRDSGAQITAKTVVAMTVDRSPNAPYADTGKESEWAMTSIGSGKISIFQDGTRIDGTWKKPARTERTRFYDAAGKEIVLNRGKIWVEVLAPTSSITVAPAPTATP